jgi:hypothetical protein
MEADQSAGQANVDESDELYNEDINNRGNDIVPVNSTGKAAKNKGGGGEIRDTTRSMRYQLRGSTIYEAPAGKITGRWKLLTSGRHWSPVISDKDVMDKTPAVRSVDQGGELLAVETPPNVATRAKKPPKLDDAEQVMYDGITAEFEAAWAGNGNGNAPTG